MIKVTHEHSWLEGTTLFGNHATEVFTCRICGVIHTADNPKVEFKPTFAYFYALQMGAPLGQIFAFYGG